eukprot:6185215-Pleurochrysis_carterae.AAC.4
MNGDGDSARHSVKKTATVPRVQAQHDNKQVILAMSTRVRPRLGVLRGNTATEMRMMWTRRRDSCDHAVAWLRM